MIKKIYKLLLFDFDGTLVDSEKINNFVISQVLLELGHHQYTYEYCNEYFAGCSVHDLINTLKHLKVSDYHSVLRMMHQRSIIIAHRELKAVKNAKNLLKKLPIPYCIVSNGEKEMVHSYATSAGVIEYFSVSNIFTRDLVVNPKPSPDLYLYAARIMGNYAPKDCLVVEDSIVGVAAGSAAGMHVIGYTGTHSASANKAKLLQDAGAFAIIDDIIKVLDFC